MRNNEGEKDPPLTSSVPVLLDVPKEFLAKHVYLPASDAEMLVMRSVPSSVIIRLTRGGIKQHVSQCKVRISIQLEAAFWHEVRCHFSFDVPPHYIFSMRASESTPEVHRRASEENN